MNGTVENRRRFERYNCDFLVELHVDSPGELSISTGVARNISSGGMLIECPTVPPAHAACHVAFSLPEWVPVYAHSGRDFTARAHVRHRDIAHRTFGVSFACPLS